MEKLQLLESVLGQGHKANRTYYQFHCSFCNHHKPKLGIDLNTGFWKCWVCNTKGSTVSGLFFKLRIDHSKVKISKELWKERSRTEIKSDIPALQLPQGHLPLWKTNKDSFFYKRALKYVVKRGITLKDIIKHQIYYNDDGYLIFPNYNEFNQLTFWSCRSYEPSGKFSHKLANVNKNIVGDENLINWDEDIILCESKLDAITIRRNAIPLYGKIISKKLKERIIDSPLENIFMCLDGDANDDILENSKYFTNNGKKVWHCNLPLGQDPNSLGFERVWEFINNATLIKPEDTFKNDILNKLKL